MKKYNIVSSTFCLSFSAYLKHLIRCTFMSKECAKALNLLSISATAQKEKSGQESMLAGQANSGT